MKKLLPTSFLLMALSPIAFGAVEVPRIVPHQGRIVVNGVNFSGGGQFKFYLYQDPDTDHENDNEDPFWKNDGSDLKNPMPANAVTVNVSKGQYSVDLGDVSLPNMTALPESIIPTVGAHIYLRIWFNDGVNGFEQLAPDQRVLSVPFARHSATADSVANGAILNDSLADQSVTVDKLFPDLQAKQTSVANLPTAGGVVEIPFDATYESLPSVDVANPGLEAFNIGPNSFKVRVPPGRIKVATDGDVGQYASLAIVAGRPCVAYYDATSTALMFVRALDEKGSAWGNPVIVDTTNDTGRWASLADINGHPAIAYLDVTNGNLRYARASNPEGTIWGTQAVVAGLGTDGVFGEYASLALVNGRPAIAYSRKLNDAPSLYYSYAADAAGEVWPDPILVPSPHQRGEHAQLKVVNGFPAIVHHDRTLLNLSWVRATNATGVGDDVWDSHVRITPAGSGGGRYNSLEIVDGAPAVTHVDEATGLLLFSRAQDPNGDDWDPPTILAANGHPTFTSLTIADGVPVLVWKDNDNGDLLTLRANDAQGTSWGAPRTVDSLFNVGSYPSLQVVDGEPAVAYYDESLRDLKFTSLNRPLNGQIQWRAITEPAPVIAAETALGSLRLDHFAEGQLGANTVATGDNSLALGDNTKTFGSAALAAGQFTIASGAASAALGNRTLASGARSLALGENNRAVGENSIVAGSGSQAEGANSFALGQNAITLEPNSLAIGENSTARGVNSLSVGLNVVARSAYEVVVGRNNFRSNPETANPAGWVPTDNLFVVAGGINPQAGRDLFKVRKDGLVSVDEGVEIGTDVNAGNNISADNNLTAGVDISAGGKIVAGGRIDAGSHIESGGEYKYDNERTYQYRLPASAFQPHSHLATYSRSGGRIALAGADTSQKFYAPLQLPHGAKITGYHVHFADESQNNSFSGATFSLHTYGEDSPNQIYATLTVHSSALDPGKYEQFKAVSRVIDNNTRYYYFEMEIKVAPATDPQVYVRGIRITYTLDQVSH